MTKFELRKEFLSKRKEVSHDKKREIELEIQSRVLMCDEYRKCKTVLTYVSTADEIDTLGFIHAAFLNGKRVAVPKTNEDFSLSFYYINSLEELKLGRFNILEPSSTAKEVTDFQAAPPHRLPAPAPAQRKSLSQRVQKRNCAPCAGASAPRR